MTRRIQTAISCSLAVCLVFASAVGFSPWLHQWVEHGGRGTAHTHLGGRIVHTHEGAIRSTTRGETESINPAIRKALSHSFRPFGLPEISFHPLRALFARIAVRLTSNFKPEPESDGGHEHHSLPQLLASGLADQAVAGEQLTIHLWIAASDIITPTVAVLLPWNVEPPGRAPPLLPQ